MEFRTIETEGRQKHLEIESSVIAVRDSARTELVNLLKFPPVGEMKEIKMTKLMNLLNVFSE